MAYLKRLIGEKCYLAPCSPEDAEVWAKWDNDLEVAIPMGDEAHMVYAVEKERTALRDLIEQKAPVFNIVLCEGDKLIGRCLLMQVDQVNRTAMLGMVIGEKEYWNSGYGLEATRLLLDYAFNLLNLNNVMLGVYSFNKRAIRCYEKAGFKKIGDRRQARIFGLRTFDMVYMDMLAEEFESSVVDGVLKQ
jgi:RimJ/RimL family protein N-acetyltransferase